MFRNAALTFYNYGNGNKRFLKIFKPFRPEIVIANNAGIFFSLASLKIHGKTAHPNLRIILPKFWLDDTHSDYDNLDWGQSIRGIPWYARQEFFEIYPNQPDDKLITWKQFKELRSYVIKKLSSFGVMIYQGTPIIEHQNSNYFINIGSNKFQSSSDTFFYNAFREPDTDHHLLGLPQISHTQIYTLPRNLVPSKIIIIGSGRSTIWLCNHFPLSQFACIKNKKANYPLF